MQLDTSPIVTRKNPGRKSLKRFKVRIWVNRHSVYDFQCVNTFCIRLCFRFFNPDSAWNLQGIKYQTFIKNMPIKPENRKRYPPNWKEISKDIRFIRAGNRCEVCQAENYKPHPVTGSKVILTVAHLDHTPENCDYSNLKAMCQKCHNGYDRDHRNHKTTNEPCQKTHDTKKPP